MLDDEIARIVDDLFALLASRRIDYLLVGGIALLNYVQGRNTEDIDLILALPDLERLPELQIESQDRDFARASFRGLRVDVLLTQNKWFDLVRREHAAKNDFGGRRISVVTPEGLILLKFYALPSLYRQGNFERVALYETDLTLLLHKYPMSVESVLTSLRLHLAEADLESLRDIYGEIERRIRRYPAGQS